MRILLLGCFLLSLLPVSAQVIVSGRLVDEQLQPVPYASIALADGRTGTASNEVGEFSLKVPALPQQLIVLSMGYERATVTATQAGPLAAAVVLHASAVQLPEVLVRANHDAEELVRRCYAKLVRHKDDVHYGRGFYRQKTREDGHYREIFDAFYDVKVTPRNMPSWVLGEARYAFTPGIIAMNNFSVYTRLMPLFVPPGGEIKANIPLGPDAVNRFNFVLRQTERSQGREVAVIDFTPQSSNATAAKGTLFIDTRTAALCRIERDMPQNGMFNSNNPQIQIGDNSLRMVTNYNSYDDSLTRVASVQAISNLRLVVKGVPHETSTASYFFVYEYGPPTPGEKYKDTKESVVDLAQIRRRRYKPDFWRDNAVIKDSPIEEAVIRDFEGKKVFGKLN